MSASTGRTGPQHHITPRGVALPGSEHRRARLHAGDILLKKADGSLTSLVIRLGQLVNRGDSTTVHAGIAEASNHMFEMQGQGLFRSNFLKDRTAYSYLVYHCTLKGWRRAARDVARAIYKNAGYGTDRYRHKGTTATVSYSMGQAVQSLGIAHSGYPTNTLLKRQYEAYMQGGSSVMCSAFVVFCYQHAAMDSEYLLISQRIFNKCFADYNPSYLELSLGNGNTVFRLTGTIANLSGGVELPGDSHDD
jgi:hypothetical protein